MLQERNCPRPPPTELTRRISYYASACPSGAFLGQAPRQNLEWRGANTHVCRVRTLADACRASTNLSTRHAKCVRHNKFHISCFVRRRQAISPWPRSEERRVRKEGRS